MRGVSCARAMPEDTVSAIRACTSLVRSARCFMLKERSLLFTAGIIEGTRCLWKNFAVRPVSHKDFAWSSAVEAGGKRSSRGVGMRWEAGF